MDQNTVFISYRRAINKHLARAIYMDLKANGWDVFFDVNSIDSGDFDRIILNQIGARAHFILLISPDSLARCANEGDWVLREIQEAVHLQRNIVPIVEESADFTREIGYLPADLRVIVSKKNALPLPHFFFEAAVDMLRNRFLKTPKYITITTPPAAEHAEVQRRMVALDTAPAHPTSLDLMPAPFAWIDIPGSIGKTWKGAPYSIAKYPITNAQFAKFIEAGGYSEHEWWTDVGWSQREKFQWKEPRYWKDVKFNGIEQPVVGVSWYEAVAYCLWLSDATGEKIMLPTEDQWQYAAQGDDSRTFPWGKRWDSKRSNSLVKHKGIEKTTSVRHYEGKGDSLFGVVDMAGNVWEWCLGDYDNKTNDMNSNADFRVLHGGSFITNIADSFCCEIRLASVPFKWTASFGFRISRS